MNIYITGDEGFVAGRLQPRLVAAGHRVSGHDLRYNSGHDLRYNRDDEEIAQVVDRICRHDAAVIINLAATLADGEAGSFERDSAIAEAACGAAIRTGAHLIHVSTVACAQADAEFVPASSYAARKAEQERVVEALCPEATIVRLNNIWGFGHGCLKGLFGGLISAGLQGTDLTIAGDGSQSRSWIRVDKLVDALIGLVDTEASTGRRLEWCGVDASVRDFARGVNDSMGLGVGLLFDDNADPGPVRPFASSSRWARQTIDPNPLPS